MPHTPPAPKRPPSPPGCDGYLTRKQAARVLGFASEFRVRELERKGLLHSVRGPMRAAFYPRPDIIALKAKLASNDPDRVPVDAWTDADLLTLLGHPKPNGQRRTAFDLVVETRISIERALGVFDFFSANACAEEPKAPSIQPAMTAARIVEHAAAPSASATRQERRRAERLSHDSLIRDLRHPDPRMREEAFAKLKQSRG